MQAPLVSILIPVFNGGKTITDAIGSCIKQSYKNIEILVLDDGSSDDTVKAIRQFETISLLQNEKNMGRPDARNTLLKSAKGEFVAWLDADDRMMPERIEHQVRFMEENPEVDIAGSWILTDDQAIPERKFPIGNAMISAHLWFKNCMVQPAVISRNFYVKENIFYDTGYYYMQDYELWYRLRNKKIFANIPEYLTLYHFSSLRETIKKNDIYRSVQNRDKLWEAKWAEYELGLNLKQKEMLEKFLADANSIRDDEGRLLKDILDQIKDNEYFSSEENQLMIHLYRLLAFKKLGYKGKLANLDLLGSILKYPRLKGMHLIR